MANDIEARRTIIVCEDDGSIQEVVALALSTEGVEAIPCDDFERLPAAIEEHRPALVLLDLHFGGRTSTEALPALTEAAGAFGARIVLMSGHATLPSIAEAHGVAFLPKPFSLADLQALVSEA